MIRHEAIGRGACAYPCPVVRFSQNLQEEFGSDNMVEQNTPSRGQGQDKPIKNISVGLIW